MRWHQLGRRSRLRDNCCADKRQYGRGKLSWRVIMIMTMTVELKNKDRILSLVHFNAGPRPQHSKELQRTSAHRHLKVVFSKLEKCVCKCMLTFFAVWWSGSGVKVDNIRSSKKCEPYDAKETAKAEIYAMQVRT